MIIRIESTSNSKKVLEKISNKLLENKLSPCVQIINKNESNYIWKNKILNEKEYKILIKTISDYENDVVKIIKKMHNYQIPEILKTEISILNDEYQNWFNEILSK